MPAVQSVRSAILICITAAIGLAYLLRDARNPPVLYGDAMGYYYYLPAVFIYHNPVTFYEFPAGAVTEDNVLSHVDQLKREGWRTPKGYIINQYTYGVSLMELPAFAVAHLYARLSGAKANGFSPPYVLAIRILNAVYALLGLLLTYRILRRFFSHNISLLVTLALLAGTNLLHFSLRQAGMSHIPLFFLYAALIWCTIRIYEAPRLWRFALIGFIAGLIILIRPTDILCLLIPLLYDIRDGRTLRERLRFIAQYRSALLLAVLVAFLPAIPQLLYWKSVSGHWLYYSYGRQSFDWTQPHIRQGVTGGNNGWLTYTPLMGLALTGLLCLRDLKRWWLCIVILLPAYLYVIYSWYCFNYINGFGSRPMIHLYPLLALPLAALLQWAAARNGLLKGAMAAIIVFLTAVNLSFTDLQAQGMLNSEDSNWPYNLGMLFRTRLRYVNLVEKDIAVRQPDPGRLMPVRTLAFEDYNDSTDLNYVQDTARGRNGYTYRIVSDEHPPGTLKVIWNKAEFGDARWLRASGRFMFPEYFGLYENHVLVVDVKRSSSEFQLWKGIRIENKIGLADSSCPHWNTRYKLDHADRYRWGSIWGFVALPDAMKDGDTIEVSVWNPAHRELYLDDVRLDLLR